MFNPRSKKGNIDESRVTKRRLGGCSLRLCGGPCGWTGDWIWDAYGTCGDAGNPTSSDG